MHVSAWFPWLRALAPSAGLHGQPLSHGCSGTKQTVRTACVSEACRPELPAECCPHSCLFFPALILGHEQSTVFQDPEHFCSKQNVNLSCVLWPCDPQHALGWKVLCSLSQFCLSLWGMGSQIMVTGPAVSAVLGANDQSPVPVFAGGRLE